MTKQWEIRVTLTVDGIPMSVVCEDVDPLKIGDTAQGAVRLLEDWLGERNQSHFDDYPWEPDLGKPHNGPQS